MIAASPGQAPRARSASPRWCASTRTAAADAARQEGRRRRSPTSATSIIFGNHSPTMFADFTHAKISGKPAPRGDRRRGLAARASSCDTVGKRGAAIIAARGLSSAASAANAAGRPRPRPASPPATDPLDRREVRRLLRLRPKASGPACRCSTTAPGTYEVITRACDHGRLRQVQDRRDQRRAGRRSARRSRRCWADIRVKRAVGGHGRSLTVGRRCAAHADGDVSVAENLGAAVVASPWLGSLVAGAVPVRRRYFPTWTGGDAAVVVPASRLAALTMIATGARSAR